MPNRFGLRVSWIALSAIWVGSMCCCSETPRIYTPRVQTVSGDLIRIPVRVIGATELAGVKLVVNYDTEVLRFERFAGSREAAGLMQSVNSGTPGLLVIAMAGATGVDGTRLTIGDIVFSVARPISKKTKTELKAITSRLLTDSLTEIAHEFDTHPIVILP